MGSFGRGDSCWRSGMRWKDEVDVIDVGIGFLRGEIGGEG